VVPFHFDTDLLSFECTNALLVQCFGAVLWCFGVVVMGNGKVEVQTCPNLPSRPTIASQFWPMNEVLLSVRLKTNTNVGCNRYFFCPLGELGLLCHSYFDNPDISYDYDTFASLLTNFI
jgi:hypothetical protein